MISGKQKRLALRERCRLRAARRLAVMQQATREPAPARTVPVGAPLLVSGAWPGAPDFIRRGYYQDTPFSCVDCGAFCVWFASRQKWWYEVAGGDLASTARRCAACRAAERQRKADARQCRLAGIEAKVGRARTALLP